MTASYGQYEEKYVYKYLLCFDYTYIYFFFSLHTIVYWVAAGTIIVVIAMPVMAPTHPTAEWVFTEFQNSTGYKNSGLAFFLGLLQVHINLFFVYFEIPLKIR